MRFAIGLVDYVFGEKVTLEVTTSNGRTLQRTVTRRWMEQMERQGKMQDVDGELVRVHHIGLQGYEVEHRVIGQDVSEDVVKDFRDPQTHDLYAMSFMQNGEPKTYFLNKGKWEAAKAALTEEGFM
jgi:hypothetical protein